MPTDAELNRGRRPQQARSPSRRPLRDSPLLLLLGIALFLAALVGLLRLADRSTELAPDYLSEVVLYALSAACITMLLVLGFILARNVLKLWVERRRAVPFARFRAKLVAALLGMTLIPAVLVLFVGSELIRNSAQRWFSAPVDEVVTSANEVARDYYRSRERVVSDHAQRIADTLVGLPLDAQDIARVRELVTPDVAAGLLGSVDVYRIVATEDESTVVQIEPLLEVAMPTGPEGYSRAAAERLAARVAAGGETARQVDSLAGGAEVVRAAAVIGSGAAGRLGSSSRTTPSREALRSILGGSVGPTKRTASCRCCSDHWPVSISPSLQYSC